MPPINDNLASATDITGSSGSIAGTLVDASVETGDELTYFGGGATTDYRSVWYKYTSQTDVRVTFDIVGSGFNPYAEVYSPPIVLTDFGDLIYADQFVGDGTTDPPDGNDSGNGTFEVACPAGYSIYVMVTNWEFNNSEGTFTLSWTTTTPSNNDDWLGATELILGEDEVELNLNNFTSQSSSPENEGLTVQASNVSSSAWYKITNNGDVDRIIWVEQMRKTGINYSNGNVRIDIFYDGGYTPNYIYNTGPGSSILVNFNNTDPDDPQVHEDDYYSIFYNSLGKLAWGKVKSDRTIWIRICNITEVPSTTNGYFKFHYIYGDRYVVNASDDWNDTSTTSLVSGAVRESQSIEGDGSGDDFFPYSSLTDTFYIRNTALPPTGKYMVRAYCKLNTVSGESNWVFGIKRDGRYITAPAHQFSNAESNYTNVSSFIHRSLTNWRGVDPFYFGSGSSAIFRSPDYEILPYLYVTEEDLTFTFATQISGLSIDIKYIEFIRIDDLPNNGTSTYSLLTGEGIVGNQNLNYQSVTGTPGYIFTGIPICTTDDGNLWALTMDVGDSRKEFKGPWLWKWDGASWTTLSTELGNYTIANYSAAGDTTLDKKTSLCLATDGEDLWMSWVEKVPGSLENRIYTKKYDVSGNSFSDVGGGSIQNTDLDTGQTIFRSGFQTLVVSHKDSSDPSRPYIYFMTTRSAAPSGDYSKRHYVFKESGGSWTNTNIPNKNTSRSVTADAGIYRNSLVMAHHDGISAYPSVIYDYEAYEAGPGAGYDIWEWIYSEYNGSSWTNTIRFNPVDVCGGPAILTNNWDLPFYMGDYTEPRSITLRYDGNTNVIMSEFDEHFSGDWNYGSSTYIQDNANENRQVSSILLLEVNSDATAFEWNKNFNANIFGRFLQELYGGDLAITEDGGIFPVWAEGEEITISKYIPCMEKKIIVADNEQSSPHGYLLLLGVPRIATFGNDIYVSVVSNDPNSTSPLNRVWKWSKSTTFVCPGATLTLGNPILNRIRFRAHQDGDA